jgi:4-hydroxyphenylpyruvate dioxygenase
MDIDHVHFYVEDASYWSDWFSQTLNFTQLAPQSTPETLTAVLQHGSISFRVSAALTSASPVAQFLRHHPAGVADVAFRVQDLPQQLQKAEQYGAKVLRPLTPEQPLSAQIQGWGGLCHTLIQDMGLGAPPPQPAHQIEFTGIDHVVLNVTGADFEPALTWYEKALGFQRDRPFEINTSRSGLRSQVLLHPEGTAQLPINAPTTANSQIQEFLDWNRGAGIQHMALRTDNLISTTKKLIQRGLKFLNTPSSYYQQRFQELRQTEQATSLTPAILAQLQQYHILADWRVRPLQSLLLQIFSQPIFGQPTFFLEFIERRQQAQGFGEGNFLALFEAIEREQLQRS